MTQKTCKVLDRSPEGAMKKAIERFGPEALVLETREVRRRKEGGLGYEKMFEMIIALEGDLQAGLYERQAAQDQPERMTGIEKIDEVTRQLIRLEKVEESMAFLEEKLARLTRGTSPYPLYRQLREGGVEPRIVDLIADSFLRHEESDNVQPREAALLHLERHIRVADASNWGEVSGAHIFFGPGGCGKTSMLIKLAGRLHDSGKAVTIVTLFPRHTGETARMRIVAETLGIETRAIYSLDELSNGPRIDAEDRVVLIDTPCCHTVHELTTSTFQSVISQIEYLTSHYVFDLSVSFDRLEKDLELHEELTCDFCVLTKLDMLRGSASFLNLLGSRLLPFSLLNRYPDFDRGLEIATRSRLLSMIETETPHGDHENSRKYINNNSIDAEKREEGEWRDEDPEPIEVETADMGSETMEEIFS